MSMVEFGECVEMKQWMKERIGLVEAEDVE
jgi:hypothetical protein